MREGESCKGTPGNYICQIPVWKSLLESAVEYCAWAEGRKKMKALKSFLDNTNKIQALEKAVLDAAVLMSKNMLTSFVLMHEQGQKVDEKQRQGCIK